jgi:glycosyltransferase involved in cell wall biosynthesis
LHAEFESNQIQFLGWCTPEKTLKLAAAANAVVVPSILEESCPTTVLEGLLLGKPTFALALGGTPELDMYAAAPDQLRLHPDMRSLVQDLVSFEPRANYGVVPDGLGGADNAVRQLLDIYRLPPGHSLN